MRVSASGLPFILAGAVTIAVAAALLATPLWSGAVENLAVDLVGRGLRSHEAERLDHYIQLIHAVLLGVLASAAVVVAYYSWPEAGGRARDLFASVPVHLGLIGAVAVSGLYLRVVDPAEFYLSSALAAAVFLLSFSYLLGAAITSVLEPEEVSSAPEKMTFGAAVLFAGVAFLYALGANLALISLCCVLAFLVSAWRVSREPASLTDGWNFADWRWLALPLLVNIVWWLALYAFSLAPPGADITTQGQIAAWILGGETIAQVEPYMDATRLELKYPPAVAIVAALHGWVANAGLNFGLLWLWFTSVVLLTAAIYALVREFVGRAWLAAAGTLLFVNAEILRQMDQGAVAELFALAFAALLVSLLLTGRRSWRTGVLAATLLAGVILTQTQVALPLLLYSGGGAGLAVIRLLGSRAALEDFVFHSILLGLAGVLILPWLLHLDQIAVDLGGTYQWVYTLWSGTFWDYKGALFPWVVGLGLLGVALRRAGEKHLRSRIAGLAAAAVALSQYRLAYEGLGVDDYSVAPAPDHPSIHGWNVERIFHDPWLSFISQQGVVSLAFVLVLGVIAAHAAVLGWELLVRMPGSNRSKRFVVIAATLAVSVSYRAEVFPASSLLHGPDYRALRWVSENTDPQGTMILNPHIDVQGTNARYGAWWVGAVSERKAAIARIRPHEVNVLEGRLIAPPPVLEMDPHTLRNYMNRHRMTHLFISARHGPAVDEWVEGLVGKSFELVYSRDAAKVVVVASSS